MFYNILIDNKLNVIINTYNNLYEFLILLYRFRRFFKKSADKDWKARRNAKIRTLNR